MKSVVIIDDEEWIRNLIKGLLPWDDLGLMVVGEESNGIEGLALCKRKKPDIVLTDIRMPGMDGLTLIETLNSHCPAAKVIIISGYDDFSYAQRAIKSGAFDYILKPIEEDGLIEILKRAKQCINKEKKMDRDVKRLKKEVAKLNSELIYREDFKEGTEVSSKHDMVKRAVAYIQQNYNREITLEWVANKVFMNANYFSELFRQEIGKGFTEYLTELRLEKAVSLLELSSLNISEVANMVGYSDSNYFARIFKKFKKITPSEFRQRTKNY